MLLMTAILWPGVTAISSVCPATKRRFSAVAVGLAPTSIEHVTPAETRIRLVLAPKAADCALDPPTATL
jgi:hypothetical protein